VRRVNSSSDDAAHAADRELVRRAHDGDREAIDALIDRLACIPAILRDRHRRIGGPLTADELAEVEQETLAAVWSKLRTFEGRASLETWAFRFTVHELMKGVERMHRGRRRRAGDATEVDLQPAAMPEEPEIDPAAVQQALERLGPPASDVIRWRHYDELSFEDIARRTGEPESTVKARYYRGLERLRELLEPHRRRMAR
jgi:RNA polymerase sigma-70 factor (ECF subfamily)